MKIKVYYKVFNPDCDFEIKANGDCVDLHIRANEVIHLDGPEVLPKLKGDNARIQWHPTKLPLGIAMKLPKGFKANVYPRSSMFKNSKSLQTNSVGVIDCSYSGNEDEWCIELLPFNSVDVPPYARLCQFDIQPSMYASFKDKLKWFLSDGVEFIKVENLDVINRGGFGTSGLV